MRDYGECAALDLRVALNPVSEKMWDHQDPFPRSITSSAQSLVLFALGNEGFERLRTCLDMGIGAFQRAGAMTRLAE